MSGLGKIHRYSRHITRTRRWQALRQQALRRDDYKCVQCGRRTRLEVDHIRPVRDAPELAYDLNNLQSLCPSCHSRKTQHDIDRPPREDLEAWREFAKQLYSE